MATRARTDEGSSGSGSGRGRGRREQTTLVNNAGTVALSPDSFGNYFIAIKIWSPRAQGCWGAGRRGGGAGLSRLTSSRLSVIGIITIICIIDHPSLDEYYYCLRSLAYCVAHTQDTTHIVRDGVSGEGVASDERTGGDVEGKCEVSGG